jgi:CBS domain-containing protein
MQLQDVITQNPSTVHPDDSVRSATKIMRDGQIGFLPVLADGVVLGVVTDRDVVIRAIAGGFDPQTTPVRDIMSRDPIQLYATDSVEKALEIMASQAIARLVVTDPSGKMVGVLSCGDLATACKGDNRAGQLRAAIHRRTYKSKPVEAPPDAQFVSE